MRLLALAAMALLLVLVVVLFVCLLKCHKDAPVPEPDASPDVVSVPVVTDVPTEAPTATPEPTWESEHLQEIEQYVRAYGNCPDEAAIAARMATMVIDPDKKMVAYTFDDGPKNTITDEILDILEQYGVRATFFVKGDNIASHEEQIMRMLSLGCEIGNHTWNHTDVETLTAAEMREEIGRVNDALKDRFGYMPRLFRPPYISYGKKGDETRTALVALMEEWNMAIINHTRSTHDTHSDYTADMIYERGVLETDELGKGLDGSIILCHDKQQRTVDAFARIVPELLDRGYQFVTVSELLHYGKDGFHVGWVYSSAN